MDYSPKSPIHTLLLLSTVQQDVSRIYPTRESRCRLSVLTNRCFMGVECSIWIFGSSPPFTPCRPSFSLMGSAAGDRIWRWTHFLYLPRRNMADGTGTCIWKRVLQPWERTEWARSMVCPKPTQSYVRNLPLPQIGRLTQATFLPKYLLSGAFHSIIMIFPKVFTALLPVLRSFSPQINLSKLFLSWRLFSVRILS